MAGKFQFLAPLQKHRKQASKQANKKNQSELTLLSGNKVLSYNNQANVPSRKIHLLNGRRILGALRLSHPWSHMAGRVLSKGQPGSQCPPVPSVGSKAPGNYYVLIALGIPVGLMQGAGLN